MNSDETAVRRPPVAPMVIIGQRIGRLGNQIQLMANLLAFHEAQDIAFCHPTLGEYGGYFRGTESDFLVRYPSVSRPFARSQSARLASYMLVRAMHKLGVVGGPLHAGSMSVDYREIVDLSDNALIQRIQKHGRFWLLGGWIYRYPLINKDFFSKARRFFELAEPYKAAVARIVTSARADAELLIGIHVRQTDFRTHEDGKFFFSTQQYANLIRQTKALFLGRTVKFLIVSDEPKTQEHFPGIECAFGSGNPIEDMYALGSCDYIMGSHASSFSLWPAFLNQVPIYRVMDAQKPVTLEDFRATTADWQLQD